MLFAVSAPSQHARADAQVSIRNQLELGLRKFEGEDKFLVGLGVRGDAMYGAARPSSFRIGPAFELRTVNVETLEGAAGIGVLIPLPGGAPIGLNGLMGSALRKGDEIPDGRPIGIGTVTWGFRGYNYHSWYGYSLNLFASGRKQIGSDLIEYTGGIEVDIVFTTIIPGAAIINFIAGGDPYED